MAAVCVTLVQAKAHLRITLPPGDPGDLDLQLKLDQAEAIILEYLDTWADPLWVSPATTPGPVTAAILILLANLFENRGDDESFGMSGKSDAVWTAIERLLARTRNPALA